MVRSSPLSVLPELQGTSPPPAWNHAGDLGLESALVPGGSPSFSGGEPKIKVRTRARMKETIHHRGWEAQLRAGNERRRTCRLFTAPAPVPGLPGSEKSR